MKSCVGSASRRSRSICWQGAGVVVLEELRHARERGAHIYAEVGLIHHFRHLWPPRARHYPYSPRSRILPGKGYMPQFRLAGGLCQGLFPGTLAQRIGAIGLQWHVHDVRAGTVKPPQGLAHERVVRSAQQAQGVPVVNSR